MEPVQEASRTVTLADRSRRAAEPQSRVSRSVADDRQVRGERSARSVGAYPWRWREQPSLSDAGRRARPRRQRRRLSIRRPRSTTASSAFTPRRDPGKTLHDVEAAIDVAILADVSDHGVTADELESRQEPADCRRRLRSGQSGDARALVRRGARDRRDGRNGARLARRNSRRDRRRGARGSPDLARPPRFGYRLSREHAFRRRRSTRE